jgi:glycosyltransferase involved in cell wall biosynthesis
MLKNFYSRNTKTWMKNDVVMHKSNKIIHSLWIGPYLSRVELLTLKSFVSYGHEFHLWIYHPLRNKLPGGVVLRNAAEILPEALVFRKKSNDLETELGESSYATYSDLFRTKLLFEHGGIWVDMDILCLKPFDFKEPYTFRAHRVGAVMNVIKCPKKSDLMRDLFDAIKDVIDQNSGWLEATRKFYALILEHNLGCFIRKDLLPEDDWNNIKGFIEGNAEVDSGWYGIHWINEMWNALKRNSGLYKGKQLTKKILDKNSPIPGTTLFEICRKYSLIRNETGNVTLPVFSYTTAMDDAYRDSFRGVYLQLNIALPSMALGGAERAVKDVISELSSTEYTSNVFLLKNATPGYDVDNIAGCRVICLNDLPLWDKFSYIGKQVLLSPVRSLYVHLIRAKDCMNLQMLGIKIIPVIQNSHPSWLDSPHAYELDCIPFIVTVSAAVKAQMVELGCKKPIIVLRHEVHKAITASEALTNRRKIRERYNISDDTILIGMVGQFKAQKAYPRAVRVLKELQKYGSAKLIILGGWDHSWGSGRATYTATCQQALQLGVMADLILPGSTDSVEPYYSAFDVFLNTSIYEGLSVSVLEAIAFGCPVVSADAGGNAEVLTTQDYLVKDSSDIEDYVKGIMTAVSRELRIIPQNRSDSSLISQLWTLIGKYGILRVNEHGRSFTIFVAENIHIGGPQRSLLNLLVRLAKVKKVVLVVLDNIYNSEYYLQLKEAGILIYNLNDAKALMQKLQITLHLTEALEAKQIVFWNVRARFKLLIAKILEVSNVSIVDVSPGPMLFNEIHEEREFGRRISFSIEEYFGRLNWFVSKYRSEERVYLKQYCKRIKCIPNGVILPDADTPAASLPFSQTKGDFIIGACCRITPTKKVEFLIDVMDILYDINPAVKLVIVGGVDCKDEEYGNYLRDKIETAGISNIFFPGRQTDVYPYLKAFKAFVMVSLDQGCPNSSLEAMAAGLPIICNDSGGTTEQVKNGINGYIVSESNPWEMVDAIQRLYDNDAMLKKMGLASKQLVKSKFLMDKMVKRYVEIL